jgi:(hydroxyamino)benzene mutase
VVNGLWAHGAACPSSPAVHPFRKEKRLINVTSPSSGKTSSANEAPLSHRLGRWLLRYGIVLFILGLATGRLVQLLPLPRMGLSSHLEGVMNGTFLVVLGLIWPHLRLHALLLRAAYWLALVGAYLNWAVTLAAAAWGAGGTSMPLAAGDHLGTPDQELILLIGLRALNVAMFASCFLVLWGLRGEGPPRAGSRSPY